MGTKRVRESTLWIAGGRAAIGSQVQGTLGCGAGRIRGLPTLNCESGDLVSVEATPPRIQTGPVKTSGAGSGTSETYLE
ncbi:MAG: hypothetical protein HKL82_07690 [Acidimicrobiaceae bacterium]|nr:hypothetical protein [Acidimicrobiaceae bacterium]